MSSASAATNQARPTKILLVEDNKVDARLTRLALERMTNWPCTIEVLDDGEKALKFLRRENTYSTADKPDLVILDLNLPKFDGTEVLQFIRASAELRNLLVFIFSSSPVHVAEDRLGSAHIKADGYFEKPNEMSTFFSIAAQIGEAYKRASQLNKGASA